MDWEECKKYKVAKEVKQDKNLILSIRETAKIKILSADTLPKKFSIGKISLLYDALREILESMALDNGYKIYNHKCYSAFLKEVLNLPFEADLFDKLRRIRNDINYYGKKVNEVEADKVISELKLLIKSFGE